MSPQRTYKSIVNGPRREKNVFGVSYKASFTCSKLTYDTFQKANNKGLDQTAQAGLHLCFSQTPEDRVSRDAAQIN